jgi:hypothetical protein
METRDSYTNPPKKAGQSGYGFFNKKVDLFHKSTNVVNKSILYLQQKIKR